LPRSASASSVARGLMRSCAGVVARWKTYPISAGVKRRWAWQALRWACWACVLWPSEGQGRHLVPINLSWPRGILHANPWNLEPAQLNAFHAGPFVVARDSARPCSTPGWFALYGAIASDDLFPRQTPIILGGNSFAPERFGSGLLYSISVC